MRLNMRVESISKGFGVGEVMVYLAAGLPDRHRVTLTLPEGEARNFHYGEVYTVTYEYVTTKPEEAAKRYYEYNKAPGERP